MDKKQQNNIIGIAIAGIGLYLLLKPKTTDINKIIPVKPDIPNKPIYQTPDLPANPPPIFPILDVIDVPYLPELPVKPDIPNKPIYQTPDLPANPPPIIPILDVIDVIIDTPVNTLPKLTIPISDLINITPINVEPAPKIKSPVERVIETPVPIYVEPTPIYVEPTTKIKSPVERVIETPVPIYVEPTPIYQTPDLPANPPPIYDVTTPIYVEPDLPYNPQPIYDLPIFSLPIFNPEPIFSPIDIPDFYYPIDTIAPDPAPEFVFVDQSGGGGGGGSPSDLPYYTELQGYGAGTYGGLDFNSSWFTGIANPEAWAGEDTRPDQFENFA